MARYPSKVTTGGKALTLQENSTRGNYVGCGRQRPPRPSTSSYHLPATLLNDLGRNSIGLDLWMSHVIVWVFRELNMVQTAISVHTAIDDKAAGSAVMKIEHATFSHNRSNCRSDHRYHAYRVLLLLFLLQVTFGPGLTKVHLRKLPYLRLSLAG